MKKLYGAFDLHSTNNHLAIIDHEDKRLYKKRLPNYPDVILAELEPFRERLAGIVVDWYWLVDLLMDKGYNAHLANPAGIQKYKGLKHSDDNHDAFWLAHLLRLGILPEGYIYPQGGQTNPRFITQKRPSGAAENFPYQQSAGDTPKKYRTEAQYQQNETVNRGSCGVITGGPRGS